MGFYEYILIATAPCCSLAQGCCEKCEMLYISKLKSNVSDNQTTVHVQG